MGAPAPELHTRAGAGTISVEALELFVAVLSQSETSDSPGDDFYDRLCAAVCRLARMRRALIFRYDPATRRVRAAGAHGIDIARLRRRPRDGRVGADRRRGAPEPTQVVEACGDLRGHFPPSSRRSSAEPMRLVCAPMARRRSRRRRDPRRPRGSTRRRSTPPSATCCGRSARPPRSRRSRASSRPKRESAKQLQQRIDLAREIHEGVIQRLFGVSMALDGEGDLPADARARCASETQAALGDLRKALQRPLGRAPRATETTLLAEVERLARAHPELGVSLEPRQRSRGAGGARAARPERPAPRRSATPASTRPRPGSRSGPAGSTVRSCSRSSTTASRARRRQRRDGPAPGGVRGAAERRRRRVRRARARAPGRCGWWCRYRDG